MKSKTSFFNKAIYKKNFTLYWPIGVCYLLYSMVKVPGSLWSGLRQHNMTENLKFFVVASSLSLKLDVWAIAVMVTIIGMALFSYLFSAKSANLIHALPVTRKELYFTNVLSGFTFLFIPQLITFMVTVMVCLANGITQVQYVGLWLVSVMGIGFFLFSLVCICAMFTGQLFALPVYFMVGNFLSVGIIVGVRYVLSFLGYGISFSQTPDILLFRILSPINYLYNNVRIWSPYTFDDIGDQIFSGICYCGLNVVIGYAVAAVFIYALAYYCYKKRKIESAGDLLTFGWIKPLFRWGAGICAGYLAAVILSQFLDALMLWISDKIFLVFVLVLGLIAFFIAQMFVEKTFRVFKKKRLLESLGFLLFVLVSYFGIYETAYHIEQYIPDADKVQTAYLENNYPVEFTGMDVEKVQKLQKQILASADVYQKEAQKSDSMNISVVYWMKNGKRIWRTYNVPIASDCSQQLADTLYHYELDADNFMYYLIGSDFKEVKDVSEMQLENYQEEEGDTNYKNVKKKYTYDLYQAVLEDAREGTIQKYNLQNYLKDGTTENEDPYASINFSFKHPDKNWKDVYQRETHESYTDTYGTEQGRQDGFAYINFGEDCRNVIQALIKSGTIKGKEEISFSNERDY